MKGIVVVVVNVLVGTMTNEIPQLTWLTVSVLVSRRPYKMNVWMNEEECVSTETSVNWN